MSLVGLLVPVYRGSQHAVISHINAAGTCGKALAACRWVALTECLQPHPTLHKGVLGLQHRLVMPGGPQQGRGGD